MNKLRRRPTAALLVLLAVAVFLLAGCDEFIIYDFVSTEGRDNGTGIDPTAPDYEAVSTSPPAWGLVGQPFTPGSSFTINEVAGNDGSQTISWSVYASADTSINAGDTLLQSGSRAGLTAGGTASIPYSGTAPATEGYYYILIDVSAGDDTNPVNDRNTPLGGEDIPVAGTTVSETESNDSPGSDPLTGATFTNGSLVRVTGTLDGSAA
jgi:hypothetical protein